MLQHNTQLRHWSALQFSSSIDFSCPWLLEPNHSLTRLAGLLHVGRSQFQITREQLSLTGFLPSVVPTVSVASMKPSLVASSSAHKHLSRTVRHSDRMTHTACYQQFHGTVCTLALSTSRVSSGLCLTNPTTHGVGAGLQLVSPLLCNTTLKYFGLGVISVLSFWKHSFTLEVFAFHAHLVHCPVLNRTFRERLV